MGFALRSPRRPFALLSLYVGAFIRSMLLRAVTVPVLVLGSVTAMFAAMAPVPVVWGSAPLSAPLVPLLPLYP